MPKLKDTLGTIAKKNQESRIITTKTKTEAGKQITTTYLKSGSVTLKTTAEKLRKGSPTVVWIE